jgi:hypothetical protein
MHAHQITTRHRPSGTPHLDGAPDDRATFPPRLRAGLERI